MIYTSHDLTVERKFCDRVAEFQGGKLVESGPTPQIFADPATDYARDLIRRRRTSIRP